MLVLEIKNLKTYYYTLRGPVKAVDSVNLQVEKGKALGLAGESGCGKTTIALSVLRILPKEGRIVDGNIFFCNEDITKIGEEEFRKRIRWKGISIVFQGAMNALNPVHTIENQIIEAITLHETGVDKTEALERARNLFALVGLDPSRLKNYPHEFSGGMRQRAMIAMALACNPTLLIADEPGTALDVIVAAQVLKLLADLKAKLGLSMIVITHDLSIIAELCDTAAIMYAGKIAESGDVLTIFKEPMHPYTQGLISAFPNIKMERTRLTSIPGSPPDLLNPPKGCRFHPRCSYAMPICKTTEPPYEKVSDNHYVSCWLVSKK